MKISDFSVGQTVFLRGNPRQGPFARTGIPGEVSAVGRKILKVKTSWGNEVQFNSSENFKQVNCPYVNFKLYFSKEMFESDLLRENKLKDIASSLQILNVAALNQFSDEDLDQLVNLIKKYT